MVRRGFPTLARNTLGRSWTLHRPDSYRTLRQLLPSQFPLAKQQQYRPVQLFAHRQLPFHQCQFPVRLRQLKPPVTPADRPVVLNDPVLLERQHPLQLHATRRRSTDDFRAHGDNERQRGDLATESFRGAAKRTPRLRARGRRRSLRALAARRVRLRAQPSSRAGHGRGARSQGGGGRLGRRCNVDRAPRNGGPRKRPATRRPAAARPGAPATSVTGGAPLHSL